MPSAADLTKVHVNKCQEYGCNNYNVGYLTTSRWSPYPILQIPGNKKLCEKQVLNIRNASAAHYLRNAVLSSSYVFGPDDFARRAGLYHFADRRLPTPDISNRIYSRKIIILSFLVLKICRSLLSSKLIGLGIVMKIQSDLVTL